MSEIEYVAFMGTPESAKNVYQEVAHNDFIDVCLDVGGKNSMYVTEDADLKKIVPGIVRMVFYNSGQSRDAVERLYAHKSIAIELANLISKEVN